MILCVTKLWSSLPPPPDSFPRGPEGKSICLQCRRPGFSPWVRKSPGEGNGNPIQYSCLENPMDGEAWCTSMGSQRVRNNWATSLSHLHPCVDTLFFLLGVWLPILGWHSMWIPFSLTMTLSSHINQLIMKMSVWPLLVSEGLSSSVLTLISHMWLFITWTPSSHLLLIPHARLLSPSCGWLIHLA